jgi:uncharacterized protein (DUF58 family)
VPRPTTRGLALLGLAAGTYLAGRVVGTWELYLFAFAFAAAVAVSLVLVVLTGRRLCVTRGLVPDHPVAGDEPELRMAVENRSWLPGPELTLFSPLAGLSEDDLYIEVESLAPRGRRRIKSPIGKVNRGVHHLSAVSAIVEDPLGLVTYTHRVSDPLWVTVYPRISTLSSCALCPQMGLRLDWSGERLLPTPGGGEFRGTRPHQPGEPLSHIDWKSTAKTGVLMLRETEEPAGVEITLLLDGTAASLLGEAPHSNYELAVRVAGSVADFALRTGHAVHLLSHEREVRKANLSADKAGRDDLLETLAEVAPDASAPLDHTLRRLRAEHAFLRRTSGVTVVALSLGEQLLRTLIALQGDGVRSALIYIAGGSPAEADTLIPGSLPPFLPPRGVSEPVLSTETRRSLLTLAAAGITCVTVARGDDLEHVLSQQGSGRRREARRG